MLFPFQDDDTSENGSREHGVSETLTVERAKEVADVGETSTVPEVVGLKTETGEDFSFIDNLHIFQMTTCSSAAL